MKKKDNRGGARPGAGRPSVSDKGAADSVTLQTVTPTDLAARYDALATEFGVSRSAALRAGLTVDDGP